MLELLDSGRMAHRFGKWRGWVVAFGGLPLLLIAWLVAELVTLPLFMSKGASPAAELPGPILVLCVGLLAVSAACVLYGFWLVYVDEMRGDYIEAAHRYKREGW